MPLKKAVKRKRFGSLKPASKSAPKKKLKQSKQSRAKAGDGDELLNPGLALDLSEDESERIASSADKSEETHGAQSADLWDDDDGDSDNWADDESDSDGSEADLLSDEELPTGGPQMGSILDESTKAMEIEDTKTTDQSTATTSVTNKPRMTLWEALTKRAERLAQNELDAERSTLASMSASTGQPTAKKSEEDSKSKTEESTLGKMKSKMKSETSELAEALLAESSLQRKERERLAQDYSSDEDNSQWDLRKLMAEMYPRGEVDLAELSDSSLESEGPLLRTGDVPAEWYERELHDGYDIDGQKVVLRGTGDNIDAFLLSRDKDELKRTVYDRENDRVHRMSDRDLAIARRLRKGKSAAEMFDVGLPTAEVFDITTGGILPKSQFTISRSDHRQILKYARAIRNGWLKVDKYGKVKRGGEKKKKVLGPTDEMHRKMYKVKDLWADDSSKGDSRQLIQAPRERRPTHEESYNPPSEYLMSEAHKRKVLAIDIEQRRGRVIPVKYDAMRKVPAYDRFLHERLQRCLDLYLCPRKVRTRTIVNPKDLLPKLPNVSELKPFPEILSVDYVGHGRTVRSLDISPCGTWLATASDDSTVRIWEVETGREFWRHKFGRSKKQKSARKKSGDDDSAEESEDESSFEEEVVSDEDIGVAAVGDEESTKKKSSSGKKKEPRRRRKIRRQRLSRVECVRFNPMAEVPLLAVVFEHRCILIPVPFVASKEEYNARVVRVVERMRKRTDSSDERSVIPQLSLDQTLSLLKQDIVEELQHWPELIAEMSADLGWEVPPVFEAIAKKIAARKEKAEIKEKQKQNLGGKKKVDDEKDIGDENELAASKSLFEFDDSSITLNTNDINLAARWCLLTLHSDRSNTVADKFSLVNNNVACVNVLNVLSGCVWHPKGDYIATWRRDRTTAALIVHRFSNMSSQIPFSKSVGEIQDVVFHPRKPWLYVATKQTIHCLDLAACKLKSALSATSGWLNTVALHPEGLNLIAGGLDGRVLWYDLDLSHKPYKTFRYHSSRAVRRVCFHPLFKLWATCGDDGKVFVFYCKMFREVFADPVLIPLKILSVNRLRDGRMTRHRVLDIKFHPTQPWLFASCSDAVTRLYTAL